MVKNACSTFVAFLAEVSRKGMLSWSANSCNTSCKRWFSPPKEHNITRLGYAIFDDLLACQIGLVSYKQLVHTLRSVTVDLLKPLLDVRESVWIARVSALNSRNMDIVRTVVGNIIYYNNAMCSTIV